MRTSRASGDVAAQALGSTPLDWLKGTLASAGGGAFLSGFRPVSKPVRNVDASHSSPRPARSHALERGGRLLRLAPLPLFIARLTWVHVDGDTSSTSILQPAQAPSDPNLPKSSLSRDRAQPKPSSSPTRYP